MSTRKAFMFLICASIVLLSLISIPYSVHLASSDVSMRGLDSENIPHFFSNLVEDVTEKDEEGDRSSEMNKEFDVLLKRLREEREKEEEEQDEKKEKEITVEREDEEDDKKKRNDEKKKKEDEDEENGKDDSKDEKEETDEQNKEDNDKGELKRRLPKAIVFGVSKCGTRAVIQFLKLHPDVVGPNPEINYFDHPEVQAQKGFSWYIQQMPLSYPNQITIEKSPDYFQCKEAPKLLYRVNKNVKLILMLRDPVDRLVSQYMQLKDKNHNDFPSFSTWVSNQESGEILDKQSSVVVGKYVEHLSEWFKVFPRNQFHIINSDDFTNHPYEELKKLEHFLHLKPFFTRDDFFFNTTKGFYCGRHRETGQSECLGESKGREHIALSEKLEQKLYAFYKPYNLRLFKLLNRTFPWNGS